MFLNGNVYFHENDKMCIFLLQMIFWIHGEVLHKAISIQSSKSFKQMPPFFLCKAKLFAYFFNTILGLMTDVNFLWWRQEETANFFFSSITSRWIVSPKFLTFVSSNLLNFNTFCFNFKKSKPFSWIFKLRLKSLQP